VRVVFLGTPETAVPSLEAILVAGHDVRLVCTQPDRPAGRSKAPQPPPVKRAAVARGLPLIQPERVRTPAFAEAIARAAPEVLAVVAYGRILTRTVLDVARHGAINLHFSLLPAFRGAAPVAWTLARGERVTGVTTFRIDEGLDTGDLLLQRTVPIAPGEHAPALLARLAIEGASLLAATLDGLAAGSITGTPQDHRRATTAPILTREHGSWDPAWTASELSGRVRGFDPWPGVWASRAGRRLRIVDAHALADARTDEASGSVLASDGPGVRVACADGTVAVIDSIQPQGGRAMTAREAVNGRLMRPGDRLDRPEPAA
jgi:methionyl-tRNA formyltransferase